MKLHRLSPEGEPIFFARLLRWIGTEEKNIEKSTHLI